MLGEELGTMTIPAPEIPIPDPDPEEVEVTGLGTCNVIKIHDDGDLTVRCNGKKFMVTPDGEIYEEYLKPPELDLGEDL